MRRGLIFSTSALTRNTCIELQETARTWRWVPAVSQTTPSRTRRRCFQRRTWEVQNIKAFFFWVLNILGQEEDLVIFRLSPSLADTRRKAADTSSSAMLSGPPECREHSDGATAEQSFPLVSPQGFTSTSEKSRFIKQGGTECSSIFRSCVFGKKRQNALEVQV